MARNITGPFARGAREVYVIDAARTPMGRSHPEKGWFRDTHPNVMLGTVYTELLRRTGLPAAEGRQCVRHPTKSGEP